MSTRADHDDPPVERRVAIDLFAGAGGATQGLSHAGYEVSAAVELDQDAADSFELNHPKTKLHREDVTDVAASTLRDRPRRLDLLKACPPCQGFSSLGKGNRQDRRNDLVTELRRFIDELRPRAFVFENVPGLAADDRMVRLLDFAREAGYGVRSHLVDAADLGVPQRRRRLIVFGVDGLQDAEMAEGITALVPEGFDCNRRSAGPVIASAGPISETEDELHRARVSTGIVAERIAAIPIGGDRFDLPKRLRLACHEGKGRVATAAYGRIRAGESSPTLTTRCTTPACGRFVHPSEHRGISLREAALLQTFPADYRFSGTYGSIEQQIGNAVPVRLAEAVGLAVAELLDRVEARSTQLDAPARRGSQVVEPAA